MTERPRLRRPLPKNRSLEQVWHHYQVESAIARRLLAAARDERPAILATMYDELFAEVPDHPRLMRRTDSERTRRAIRSKRSILDSYVTAESTVLEFAPGDCRFAATLAHDVAQVIGVDISDQRATDQAWPTNFDLIVYDGSTISGLDAASIDVVFSDQLIEHLHPDDALDHLGLCASLLRPGGHYVIRTPHRVGGPWDVSRYFCDSAEGFHLREWTFGELRNAMLASGFRRVHTIWNGKGVRLRLPWWLLVTYERAVDRLPKRWARRLMAATIPTVACVGVR